MAMAHCRSFKKQLFKIILTFLPRLCMPLVGGRSRYTERLGWYTSEFQLEVRGLNNLKLHHVSDYTILHSGRPSKLCAKSRVALSTWNVLDGHVAPHDLTES